MRRRPRRSFAARFAMPLLVGPALTLGTMGWLYLAAGGGQDGGPPAFEIVRTSRPARAATDPADLSRDVTPAGVTALPSPGEPLVRLPADPRPAAPPPEAETVFNRVIVVDGASFRTIRDKQPVVVHVAGVEAPAFSTTCTDAAGQVWKCGAKSRAELARLIGGKAVACARLETAEDGTLAGRCRVGSFDLARWLVEQGWADPAADADPALADAAAKAKADGKGRFGPAPLGVIAG